MFEYHHKTAPWEGHPPHPPLPMRPHEPPPPHWQGPPPPRSSEPPPAPYYELPAGVMVPLVPVRIWMVTATALVYYNHQCCYISVPYPCGRGVVCVHIVS